MVDSDLEAEDTQEIALPGDEDSSFNRWLADVWDEEVEPPYGKLHWDLILQHLQMPLRPQVLVAGCATGAIIPALLRQMEPPDQGRVIALESQAALLHKARQRVAECDRRRVFLKGESMRRLRFADGVFDVVVSNLTWLDLPEPGVALEEFFRVLSPGGHVALGLPLSGTLQEIYDLFAEVALKYDLPDVHRGLEALMKRRHPEESEARALLEGVGFGDVTVWTQEHEMSFTSGQEFFDSVLIRALFEPRWRKVAGELADPLFAYTRETIDTYFTGEPFLVRLVAGCICGVRPG